MTEFSINAFTTEAQMPEKTIDSFVLLDLCFSLRLCGERFN
jgi:hypothetical protein